MRWSLAWTAAAGAWLASVVAAVPVDAGRTLVIADAGSRKLVDVDDLVKKLEADGFVVETHDEHDEFALVGLGERNFDNLLVLPTKARALGPALTAAKLMEFFELGGSVLAVTDPSSAPEAVRDFAAELDVHIAPRGYKAADHFSGADPHQLELSGDSFVGPAVILDDAASSSLAYSGSAAYLGNSPYVVPLLMAPETAYVYDSRDEDEAASRIWVAGSQTALAAGVQSRDNARFAWTGSPSLFSTASAGLALAKWAFHETGIVRVDWVQHGRADANETGKPAYDTTNYGGKLYKVSEELAYRVGLSTWDGKTGEWAPYNADDVQLEFTMLDPYYRLTLSRDGSDGPAAVYGARFTIPDQHGMFTLRLAYRRPGLSFIDESEVVTVRHVANDEWPRSWQITNSWVYASSAGAVVAAWAAFVLFYLYLGPTPAPTPKKTK